MNREFVVSGQKFVVSEQFLSTSPASTIQLISDDQMVDDVIALLWQRCRRGVDVKPIDLKLADYVQEAVSRKKEFLIRHAVSLYEGQSGRQLRLR